MSFQGLVSGAVVAQGEEKATQRTQLFSDTRLLDASRPPWNRGTETYLKLVDPDGANPVTLLTQTVDPRGPSFELTSWR